MTLKNSTLRDLQLRSLLVVVVDDLGLPLDDLEEGEGALRVRRRAVAQVLPKVPRREVLVQPLRRAQAGVHSEV